jgi:hypothetical protein
MRFEELGMPSRTEFPSQLVIHNADGKIEDEATYLDDPYPPSG